MNIILVLLIGIVLSIDFAKLDNRDRKVLYIYTLIVAMILSVALADRYEFFETSPLETGIEKMQPITDWVETKFD